MLRILLFLGTNVAILAMLSVTMRILAWTVCWRRAVVST